MAGEAMRDLAMEALRIHERSQGSDDFGPRRGKRVVLVGFANSKEAVPWDEKPDAVVGINDLWSWFEQDSKRYATHWFEIHDRDTVGEVNLSLAPRQGGETDKQKHLAWLRARRPDEMPIYMQEHYDDIPASVKFPLAELNARFEKRMPGCFHEYFTSSIGMMLAFFISAGRDENFAPIDGQDYYTRIDMYGIDLAGDSEYVYQRPNAEFFSGFAGGLGIDLHCHPDSAMFRGECIYAYEKSPADDGVITRAYLEKQKADLSTQMAKQQEIASKANATINTLHGAIQMCDTHLKLLSVARRGVRGTNLVRA